MQQKLQKFYNSPGKSQRFYNGTFQNEEPVLNNSHNGLKPIENVENMMDDSDIRYL